MLLKSILTNQSHDGGKEGHFCCHNGISNHLPLTRVAPPVGQLSLFSFNDLQQAFFCAKPKNPVRNFGKPSSQNFQKTQFSAKNPVQNLPKLSFFHKISQKIAKFVLKICNFDKTQFKISKNPVPKVQKLSFSEI